MNKEEIEAKLAEMVAVQERLNPIVARLLERMMDKHGVEGALSVASYVATNLLAVSLLVIENEGGDSDAFMQIVLRELAHKHAEGRAGADALRAIDKASVTSGFTCRPRD
jgi:Holliday junction resolvasome RuvABC ATP-dependent DNA helicase subunit